MKRIGLISDTHGHYDIRYAKYFSNCDEIWHAGDIGDIQVIDQLNKIAPTKVVYGNIDNHVIRAEYEMDLYFKIEEVSIFMTHIGGKPYSYPKRISEKLALLKPNVGHNYIIMSEKAAEILY